MDYTIVLSELAVLISRENDSTILSLLFLNKYATLADMVQQITKGIKISVKTKYEGALSRNLHTFHNFSYYITIENKSEDTVQLTDRYWEIFDSLNATEVVQGEGVVGQTPILKPRDVYTYKSGCILHSNIGTMKGYFTMLDIDSLNTFSVTIPSFQLTTPISSN